MGDKIYALSVILEKDVSEEGADHLISVLKTIKGVLEVRPYVADIESCMAEERARFELGKKIMKVIYPQLYKE